MKSALILLAAITISTITWHDGKSGELINGKCSVCVEEGFKSTVTCGSGTICTTAYCGGGYYDEGGKFHEPEPCNTCSVNCRCSRGHWLSRIVRSH